MSRTKEKEQLGMSYGKASHILKLMVLFKLLRQLNQNYCLRCKKVVLSFTDLSLDHIEPWRGRNTELFWDLDNLSYSHKRCNLPHTIENLAARRQSPDGTSWCNCCKEHLEVSLFRKEARRWSGLSLKCKWCESRRGKGRTKNNQHPHEYLVEPLVKRIKSLKSQGRPPLIQPIRKKGASKICAKCKLDKSHDDFPFKNGKPQSQCKVCRAEYLKEWYQHAKVNNNIPV